MANHIKKMLRIVKEILEVSAVTQDLIKRKQTQAIYATLSHTPNACHQCGSSQFDSYGNSFQSTYTAATTIKKIEVVSVLRKESRREIGLFDFSSWG